MSIKKAIDTLNSQHQKFIEANYHLHHKRLIKERQKLMENNEIYSKPWIEATPLYIAEKLWKEYELPLQVKKIFQEFRSAGLEVHDPPYNHQGKALQAFFRDNKNLIVSTGTGSGKTEIFLYSIIGNLALEAERKKTMLMRGFRAIILYPMNALVADQLSRLRLLFGKNESATILENHFGRRVQFGMLTSRTQYHGHYDEDKNDKRVKPIIKYYCNLLEDNPELFKELDSKGRIPVKDLISFRNFHAHRDKQFRTQPNDVELFTRQEMYEPNLYGGVPDILITNYSMLEYMLLRPIERTLFTKTKGWLDADPDNKLILVLDEAHLYRGAQGAEVALLISRLLQRLDITSDRIRYILTSASLGPEKTIKEVAPKFAADLTTCTPNDFVVITGAKEIMKGGDSGDKNTAEALIEVDYRDDDKSLITFNKKIGWENFDSSMNRRVYLFNNLPKLSVFRLLHQISNSGPIPLEKLSKKLFPDIDENIALEATGNLLHLGSLAIDERNKTLLPARLHIFFKGISSIYACINPNCTERLMDLQSNNLLGRFYCEPRSYCPCGGRVFELLSHRTCGAAYIRAFRHKNERNHPLSFLWTENQDSENLDELHILVEKPREDLNECITKSYINIKTGHLTNSVSKNSENEFIEVIVPEQSEEGQPWSWNRCPSCGIKERKGKHGKTKIMDLETKGENVFANIVKTTFEQQPPNLKKLDRSNQGRKLLCFSDGRQKAAKFARDLQNIVEEDSFREVFADIINSLPTDKSLVHMFPALVVYAKKHKIGFFDDSDKISGNNTYEGSRTRFEDIISNLDKTVKEHRIESVDKILNNPHAVKKLNKKRPRQYNSRLLKLLGHEYFSISATLVGFLRPIDECMNAIINANPDINPNLLKSIILEVLKYALGEQAIDDAISPFDRIKARSFSYPRKGGEGLENNEIIPEYIKEKLPTVNSETWDNLIFYLSAPPDQDEGLFSPLQNGRFVINPKLVKLQLALDFPWMKCEGCKQFSVCDFNGNCPNPGCNGKLNVVSENDPHLLARKSFLRDTCVKVISRKKQPLTLRSEEHSAQLSTKDRSEVFSKTEKYELMFQDVPVDKSGAVQPIDVLSCTTTMEVGIDIGSLTAIAMRTVPPRPENYQQRSGRAGRRGTGLSTIITFADNSPHETYYFKNPELMIGHPASEPVVYVGNRKIAERHINASLIEQFFDPIDMNPTADVFSSLGSGYDFFEEQGKYSIDNFKKWLNNEMTDGILPEKLGRLLPGKLKKSIPNASNNWRSEFVKETAKHLVTKLDSLKNSRDWSVDGKDEDFLSILLDAAILPTFSFPIDVCNFVVKETEQYGSIPKTSYEMSRGLKEALSDYIPGRQIVVDKKTFTSYGLYFPFPPNPVDRADSPDWDSLDWLNFCPSCRNIVSETRRELSVDNVLCEVCGRENLISRHIFRPEGFSPEVREGLAEEGEEWEEERVYAEGAKFPIASSGKDSPPDDERNFGCSKLQRMSNRDLWVVNFGPDNDGFEVCRKCGAVGRDGPLSNPHNRPYPRDIRVKDRKWSSQCKGSPINTTFGYTFPTDLTVLRIPLLKLFNYAPDSKWFNSAARSALEALVRASSLVLGIDSSELAGGYRVVPKSVHDKRPGLRGYLDLFLYDTTSGGAGFSTKAYDRFDDVIKGAIKLFNTCICTHSCHSCLRSYQNKIWHLILDRFLGLSLLEYSSTNNLPIIESNKALRLRNLLETSLKLINPKIEVKYGQELTTMTVKLGMKKYDVDIISCLFEKPIEEKSNHITITDYDLDNNLPELAYTILELLETG